MLIVYHVTSLDVQANKKFNNSLKTPMEYNDSVNVRVEKKPDRPWKIISMNLHDTARLYAEDNGNVWYKYKWFIIVGGSMIVFIICLILFTYCCHGKKVMKRFNTLRHEASMPITR